MSRTGGNRADPKGRIGEDPVSHLRFAVMNPASLHVAALPTALSVVLAVLLTSWPRLMHGCPDGVFVDRLHDVDCAGV